MNNILELTNVTKEYKNGSKVLAAVKDLNYSLKEGEDVAIVGPSGSGKSTLLNLIGGLDRPTKGQIVINGQDLSKLNDKQLSIFRNQTIGFVFQFFNLQEYLMAYENVMIPLLFAGVNWKKARERAISLLENVGLANRIEYYPRQLSGGEMQRVAVARSLANNPKILLADEPTANLDKESAQSVLKLFKEINTKGVSLIVITHDQNVSKEFSHVVQIDNGELSISKSNKK
ncbi:MAG: ABC transporter ATP-binding protein [Patescibacteria group bacterium]